MHINRTNAESASALGAGWLAFTAKAVAAGKRSRSRRAFCALSTENPEEEWPDYEDSSEDDTTLIYDDGEDE